MNRPDIEAIEKRWGAATSRVPGEWRVGDTLPTCNYVYRGNQLVAKAYAPKIGQTIAIADFIARTPADVPDLCAYVKWLEARVAELEAALRGFAPGMADLEDEPEIYGHTCDQATPDAPASRRGLSPRDLPGRNDSHAHPGEPGA